VWCPSHCQSPPCLAKSEFGNFGDVHEAVTTCSAKYIARIQLYCRRNSTDNLRALCSGWNWNWFAWSMVSCELLARLSWVRCWSGHAVGQYRFDVLISSRVYLVSTYGICIRFRRCVQVTGSTLACKLAVANMLWCEVLTVGTQHCKQIRKQIRLP
jgi:hypothetical protein